MSIYVSPEAEERCGYFISEKMKRIWNCQLSIAEEIKRICKKHDINYFIIWGSLLGQVRHGGYIPWDDDFDIAMTRDNYRRFCDIAPVEIGEPLFFQTIYTDKGYFLGYSRIRNSNTTGLILENYPFPYNNGIYVDIYPLDNVIDNIFVRKLQYHLRDRAIYKCVNWLKVYRGETDGLSERELSFYKSTTLERLFSKYERIVTFGNKFKTSQIGMVHHPTQCKIYRFDEKLIEKLEIVKFEDTEFCAPSLAKDILSQVYGDYMKFPPLSKRGQWHSKQVVFEPDISFVEFIRKWKESSYEWKEQDL